METPEEMKYKSQRINDEYVDPEQIKAELINFNLRENMKENSSGNNTVLLEQK
jgi:hypothetical protein